MIKIIPNFLTSDESKWYIDWYKENGNRIFRESNQFVTNYEGIEVDKDTPNFPLFKKVSVRAMEYLRIQRTDRGIIPNELEHTHDTPYNFVIFLNEDFVGGELWIGGEWIKPKTGTMVYFSGDVGHYPKRVTEGNRWVMVSFLNADIKPTKRELI